MNAAIVGTYTKEGGAGILTFDIDIENQEFHHHETTFEPDPSFLAFHPSAPFFFSVNEKAEGSVVSYRLDSVTGKLSKASQVRTGSRDPCHIALDSTGQYAVVSNYSGGAVTLLSINEDDATLRRSDIRHHDGSGPHPDRQRSPHPHSAYFINESIVFVPDLGVDRLFVYELDREEGSLIPRPTSHVDIHDGAGPRHFAIHPSGIGYLLNELDSSLTTLDVEDPMDPAVLETQSTLPGVGDGKENLAADIHTDPTGQYLLSSNRGNDSLAMFEIGGDPERPQPLGLTPSGGKWPRNFTFTPDGNYVYCCHQHSHEIVVFKFDDRSGSLSKLEDRIEVKAPTFIQFNGDLHGK